MNDKQHAELVKKLAEFNENNPKHKKNSVLHRRVLQLNRNFQPVTTVSLRKAINKVIREQAVIIVPPTEECPGWQELAWSDWELLKPLEGETVLEAACRVFRIPEIIKCTTYGKVPYRKVKISRKAIFQRDKYTCMYCGKKPSVIDLTIDHIIPRCQGGKTDWLNVAIACVDCNRKKDDRTPEQAKMPLLKQPHYPDYDILQGRMIRIDSWQHFLGDCYWNVPLKD